MTRRLTGGWVRHDRTWTASRDRLEATVHRTVDGHWNWKINRTEHLCLAGAVKVQIHDRDAPDLPTALTAATLAISHDPTVKRQEQAA